MCAGEAGNEKGYVVKMTDDTLSPPYKVMPGMRVRLESAYDGTERRTGVMGCARRASLKIIPMMQALRAMGQVQASEQAVGGSGPLYYGRKY